MNECNICIELSDTSVEAVLCVCVLLHEEAALVVAAGLSCIALTVQLHPSHVTRSCCCSGSLCMMELHNNLMGMKKMMFKPVYHCFLSSLDSHTASSLVPT